MAIEGPLRELGIHDVFQLLDLSRKTGVLRVSSELRDDEGVVAFDAGRVVQASIRSTTVPVEIALLRAGKVTEDDLAAARAAKTNGRAEAELVDLMLDQGAITSRELERTLRLQIESVVFELMSWREGFFSFEERPAEGMPADFRIQVSTESLLMEGARRIDEWSRIADKVPSLSVVPTLAPVPDEHQAPQLDLLPHEWEVLTMIDGDKDLRSIAAALGRSDFEVAKVAYGLVTTGVVTLSNGVVQDTSAPADNGSTTARITAARALAQLGRHVEALEALRRAVSLDPLTPIVHMELGFGAARVGDLTTARSSWEHFIRIAPGAPEIDTVRAALESTKQLLGILEAHAHG